MIESSIVTLGGKIIDYNKGTAASVEFDFERVWCTLKKGTHINSKWLQFIHVHPQGMPEISAKDINCIKGFNMALSKDFYYLFGIVTFFTSDLFDISHTGIAYLCNHGLQTYKEVTKELLISTNQLIFLKYLAYYTENTNANI